MGIKQKITYETDDGQVFKKRKDANRHATELYVINNLSYTPERFDYIFQTLLDHKLLKRMPVTDWRDLCELKNPNVEMTLQTIIFTYERYTKATAVLLDTHGITLHRLDDINLLKDGEKEKAITTLTAMAGDEYTVNTEKVYDQYRDTLYHTRDWYKAWQRRREDDAVVVLVAEHKPMGIHEKLEKGIELSESELDDFAYGCAPGFTIEYEEEGDDRRWSRTVTTVLKEEKTETLWCIDWDKGLTEMQEDSFYNQPYKVTLEQTPVTIMKTTIKKVEE